MNLASEVPPDVLSSGVTPVAFSTELVINALKSPGGVRKASGATGSDREQ